MSEKKLNIKGTKGQDLTAARAELKAFRHDVAILKKKGILDKFKYDARSVNPSKYLKSQIKQFQDVLTGKAQTVKVNKKNLAQYKQRGLKTKNGRVVVPVQQNEKVYSTHGDFRTVIRGTNGSITKINTGMDSHNVATWREQLLSKDFKLKKNEILSFQLFGNNSHRSFAGTDSKTPVEQLLEYIEYYPSFFDAESDPDPDKISEYIDNIVIFKVKRDVLTGHYDMPEKNAASKEKRTHDQDRYGQRKQSRYISKMEKMTDKQEAAFLKRRAETERQRRAGLTEAQRTEYKKAAQLRAVKSRENKKAK